VPVNVILGRAQQSTISAISKIQPNNAFSRIQLLKVNSVLALSFPYVSIDTAPS
jgi:hypothetical protein